MSLTRDLYFLVNDYLDHSTRRTLARVSSSFNLIHQRWCIYRAQSLLQRCPFLGYLGVTRLTTMLRSKVTIIYTPELPSTEPINSIFEAYDDIDNDEYNRTQIEEVLKSMIHRRGMRRIPVCLPLFIFDSGNELIVLDDELNLYVDGKQVVRGVVNIDFHSDYLENSVVTEQGEVYDFETEDGVRRICQTGFVSHYSGIYHIHDSYYLSDDDEFDMKVSDDPVVLLRHGDSTCLITCAGTSGVNRTSFILGIYDNEIIFRSLIPPVHMAVDIKLGYLVLLDDGSCAILRRDIYDDPTHTEVIIQDITYDHIARCGRGVIVGRRGDKLYQLDILGNRVIQEEIDGFFLVQGYNGVYKLSY